MMVETLRGDVIAGAYTGLAAIVLALAAALSRTRERLARVEGQLELLVRGTEDELHERLPQ